jgi:1-acyl-sn-glycerol-3-phosphate acyltransferase
VFGARNLPRTGGALLVSNHQSYLDPVLVALALERECCFMARDSLFRNPIFRHLIERLNAIPVKRGTADLGAVKAALRRLKRGMRLVVFPEATRSVDGTIALMQAGVVLLARKAGVPIVPTLIAGAYRAWPRHARFVRPSPIRVAYGEPVSPDHVKSLSDSECINLVRDRILQLAARHGT